MTANTEEKISAAVSPREFAIRIRQWSVSVCLDSLVIVKRALLLEVGILLVSSLWLLFYYCDTEDRSWLYEHWAEVCCSPTVWYGLLMLLFICGNVAMLFQGVSADVRELVARLSRMYVSVVSNLLKSVASWNKKVIRMRETK